MSKEEILQGLRKNWYLVAALAVLAILAVAKLLIGAGEDTPPTPPEAANAGPVLQPPQASLDALLETTRPDEKAKALSQIEEYQKKLDREPNAEDNPAYLMAMGNLYRQKLGDYENAIHCYERIILDFPESTGRREAFLQLEACYLKQEDRTGLRWVYDKMVEEFPEESQEYKYATQQLEDL